MQQEQQDIEVILKKCARLFPPCNSKSHPLGISGDKGRHSYHSLVSVGKRRCLLPLIDFLQGKNRRISACVCQIIILITASTVIYMLLFYPIEIPEALGIGEKLNLNRAASTEARTYRGNDNRVKKNDASAMSGENYGEDVVVLPVSFFSDTPHPFACSDNASPNKRLGRLFEKIDTNKNGKIERNEWKEARQLLNRHGNRALHEKDTTTLRVRSRRHEKPSELPDSY